MAFRFTKWHGCGNDFVMVDAFHEDMSAYEAELSALAQRACDRHFGIGGDGLILVSPSEVADFRMRYFNADGSESEMCGNGIRCLGGVVHREKLSDATGFTVETGAGILVLKLVETGEDRVVARVDMGEPILDAPRIPIAGYGTERIVERELRAAGEVFHMTGVSMGNPHAVIFRDDAETLPLDVWGPAIERHAAFPRKTNVEFVKVIDRGRVIMRVWERGAGVTLACGTGTCATTVAGVLTGRTDREVRVEVDGGTIHVKWDEDDNHLYMTGPAVCVFEGVYE